MIWPPLDSRFLSKLAAAAWIFVRLAMAQVPRESRHPVTIGADSPEQSPASARATRAHEIATYANCSIVISLVQILKKTTECMEKAKHMLPVFASFFPATVRRTKSRALTSCPHVTAASIRGRFDVSPQFPMTFKHSRICLRAINSRHSNGKADQFTHDADVWCSDLNGCRHISTASRAVCQFHSLRRW